jgi:5,10-methylenetetrahydromethanopterin reductase
MADVTAEAQRVGVALREPVPWHDFLQLARTAEETGYEALFVPEIAGREGFSTLAGVAPATSSLRLATGVVPITARLARTTAMAAATVQELSGGRLILGLGAGFERSIEAVRAYVREIRETPLTFDPGEPAPIWLAALGDRMFALAGEIADGVLLNWCTPERVQGARTAIAGSAERAGRDPSSISVGVYVRACVEPDQEVAVDALRPQAAQYASLPHYRRQMEAMGLGAEAEAAARGEVPDALVRALCLVGDPRAMGERLGEYRAAGADLPVVYPVPVLEPVSSLLATLLALAPRPALEA